MPRHLTIPLLATAVACSAGGAPELTGLTDQVAQVGSELTVTLDGSDPDGDRLEYDFGAADLGDIGDRARLTVSPSGVGVFRWTPLAADVGRHAFDFSASDGDHTTTVTVTIDVKSAIGSATAPAFVQPLGTGTTLDLTVDDCVDLDIVIEDQDTTELEIAQEEPLIPGATLTQEDGTTAHWRWCPSAAQAGTKRNTLILSASDGENPKTLKTFLVVLRDATGVCPGAAPTIEHVPANVTSGADLTIDARVRDDRGVIDAPLFYFSTTRPSNPPDLAQMVQLSTLEIDGSPTDGIYAADVPNPAAGLPSGTQRSLFYVFVADDNDDAAGSCDHTTTSPVFEMTVTSNGAAACIDDVRENDDAPAEATAVTATPFVTTENEICAGDDDWYKVRLFDGDRLTLDLTFVQLGSDEDLDLHLFKGPTLDLWPCSVEDPSTCSIAHGQSASSNEHAVETVVSGCAQGCDYFVVVRGFNDAANGYDLRIGVD
jgi:hypothetical protein